MPETISSPYSWIAPYVVLMILMILGISMLSAKGSVKPFGILILAFTWFYLWILLEASYHSSPEDSSWFFEEAE